MFAPRSGGGVADFVRANQFEPWRDWPFDSRAMGGRSAHSTRGVLDIVPLQQSRRLIDRLDEVNVPARLVVREGMGHAWSGWEADTVLIAEWFDAHLRVVH